MNFRALVTSTLLVTGSWIYAGSFDSLEHILYGDHPTWYYLFAAFMAGLFVSLTPCIYPMIPITAGIIHPHASSLLQSFTLSLTYVLGMASIYAVLGYFVAVSGGFFGAWMANPWVIGIIVGFLVYMALATLGFYELHIPRLFAKLPSMQAKGSYVYTYLAGALSGTVASPCVSPALFALLTFVAMAERPFLGFFLLFSFALGMSMVLLLVGTFSGVSAHLPRAGLWMVHVKYVMGFMLLGVAVSMLLPFISDAQEIAWYGAIVCLAGVFYWYKALHLHPHRHIGWIVVGTLLFMTGSVMMAHPWLEHQGYTSPITQLCGMSLH